MLSNLRRRRAPLLVFAIVVLAGCAGVSTVSRDTPTDRALAKIEHVVVIYGENRSFDNLYGLFPGADGIAAATSEQVLQRDRDGALLPMLPPTWKADGVTPDPMYGGNVANAPFRIDQPPVDLPLVTPTRDLTHRFYQNRDQINGGKLDQYVAWTDAGGLVMGYYDGSSLPLWSLAKQYTLADNFFMGAFGGSFLNHLWLICACTPTFPNAPASLVSTLDANGKLALKPGSPASAMNGAPQFVGDRALTPDFYAVNTIQPAYQPSGIAPAAGGDPALADPAKNPLPPQTAKTIGDTLSAKRVDWAWYAGSWNAGLADGMQPPSAKREIIYNQAAGSPNFVPHHQPFNYFSRYAPGSSERARHLRDYTDLVADIDAGKLPAVAFYKPQGIYNEHPGYTDVRRGDEHIAGVVAKLQASPLWRSTLIIITYDENGGFWDHVAPPAGDRWGPATRVPTILIGPMVKKGFVDRTAYDTTSILKFLTRRFDLEPLPGVRAGMGDLTPAIEIAPN